jgi:hypothetical protein
MTYYLKIRNKLSKILPSNVTFRLGPLKKDKEEQENLLVLVDMLQEDPLPTREVVQTLGYDIVENAGQYLITKNINTFFVIKWFIHTIHPGCMVEYITQYVWRGNCIRIYKYQENKIDYHYLSLEDYHHLPDFCIELEELVKKMKEHYNINVSIME